MARNLVSIQRIKDIKPIDGADRIELAQVLGWQCVVNKGSVSVGDLCAYCEIDSFLPIRDEFEFLRKSSYKNSELLGEGFRIKTMKMRGELSQGLIITEDQLKSMGITNYAEGDDITEQLGVKKYEIPERLTTSGTIIGGLGVEVPKTDETRIQNAEDVIKEFAGLDYYISTKVDGSSHSIAIDRHGKFHVYGHNYEYANDGKSSFYEFVNKRFLEQKAREAMLAMGAESITVQGEWAGPGIQKNRLQLKEGNWFVFTVILDGIRVDLDTMLRVAEMLKADTVMIEERGFDLPSKYPIGESLLKRAEGQYPNGGNKEGIVVRPVVPIYSSILGTWLSLKAVSNKYLLKNG